MKNKPVNWTWNNAKERYRGFWKPGDRLPDGILEENPLAERTREMFCKGSSALFEPLRIHQPKTWAMLTEQCTTPMLVQDETYPQLVDILTTHNEQVVFVEPFAVGDDLHDWDRIRACLPVSLHGYYANFNGMHASFFCLGPASYNLPKNASKWRRVNDYRKEERLQKKAIAHISDALGDPEHIWIFIETECQDLVMVNANARDGKVYVAPKRSFDNFFELQEPATAIDSLCSHVLTGQGTAFYLLPGN